MPVLICTRGLPGSGKSQWAKERVKAAEPGTLVRLNRDDLRQMLHGRAHHIAVTEQQVTAVQHAEIERFLRSGVDVIVDDTLLRAKHLKSLAEIAWRVGADVEVEDFTDVPLETCLQRDAVRSEPVGEDVIRRMHGAFLADKRLPLPVPLRPEAVSGRLYVPNTSKPLGFMVDIDGTVSLGGDRDPYDFARCGEDLPNWPVIRAVNAKASAGYQPVYCSGREDSFWGITKDWLVRHVRGAERAPLFMRKTGDRRRDDVVKRDLFDEHIRDRWNVVGVFDDRRRVVEMWRSMGLTVFHVAPGEF